ncbi:MAG: class I SAM-dependent methyltransferase [Planctomycetes bacterium]|nr:class I SAM-dependent methyltransferase [Planctomycetota bacterium]
MPEPSSEEVLRPYREAIEAYGAGFEATLWGSREAQQLRFRVMIELAGFADGTILDVGCGTGDFAAALLDDGVPFRHYTGVDALEPVIAAARQRDLARCTFEVRDVLADDPVAREPIDYVCLSGTLNTMDEDTARALVRRLYDSAAQGIVFNFLSDRPHPRWSGRDLTPARRYDTVAWVAWALGLSSRVRFTQEYLDGHDATILIRHDGTS